MSTELERRIATAVRTIADEIPVDPPPAAAVHARAVRRRTAAGFGGGWLAPALTAAAAVVLLVALALALPDLRPGPSADRPADRPATPAGRATLPKTFADPSLLTASVSDSPPGPAIALLHQGSFGTPGLGTKQLVVVGIDGRTYRRLDLAERRGSAPEGEWWAAPETLLAPDGSVVAVVDPARVGDRIELVDLRTGRVRTYHLDPPTAVRPLAWSPNGRWLALMTNEAPIDHNEFPSTPAILDTETGAIRRFDRLRSGNGFYGASFAPDGERIALATTSSGNTIGNAIRIVDLTGTVLYTLPAKDALLDLRGQSWSPDGRLLVGYRPGDQGYRLTFVDATGQDRPVPPPRQGDPGGMLLGWRSPDTMLYQLGNDVAEVPVDGGPTRILSRFGHGWPVLGGTRWLHLATGLVADAAVRDPGPVERGPWPWWWRLTLAAAALFVAWRAIGRRRRRRRQGQLRLIPG